MDKLPKPATLLLAEKWGETNSTAYKQALEAYEQANKAFQDLLTDAQS